MKLQMKQMALAITAASLGFAGAASAGLSFNPDGAPGGVPTIDVGSFDWAPTSFLALGGTQAFDNFNSDPSCPSNSCDFDVLVHSKMIGTLDQDGNINSMPGLGTSYEITMITRFTETVVGTSSIPGVSSSATFITVPNQGFVEWYYDSNVDSNDLEGANFNDGTLILSGQVDSAAVGSFAVDLTQPLVAEDGFGSDDYPGQQTVQGSGSQGNISVGNLVLDMNFFSNAFGLTLDFANISTGLPFISVDPSDCFTGAGAGAANVGNNIAASGCAVGTHVAGTHADNLGTDGAPGINPDIAGVNGFGPGAGGGPDFVAQTDFNSPVTNNPIPEPGSLLLLGVGLMGLGLRRRKLVVA